MNLFSAGNVLTRKKRLGILFCFSQLWMVFQVFGQQVTLKESIQKEHESLLVETGSYAEMVAYSGGAIKPVNLSMLSTLTDSSKANDKPIIFYFFADWDIYSHKMRKETFQFIEISGLLNQEFYFIALNEKKEIAKDLYKQITGNELKSFPMTVYWNPKKNYSFQYPGYQSDYIYISNLFKTKKIGYTKINNRNLNNLGQLFKKDYKLIYSLNDHIEALDKISVAEAHVKKGKSLSEADVAYDNALYSLKDEDSFDHVLKNAGFIKFSSSLSYDQKDSLRTDEYVSLDTLSSSILKTAVVFRNLRNSLKLSSGSKESENIQTYMAKHLMMIYVPPAIRNTISEYCKKNMTLTESTEKAVMYSQKVRDKLSIDRDKGLIYKEGFSITLMKNGIFMQYD